MASQKEKLLISAQKFIQKGQLERAIKDYEQVIAADPQDIRLRQKLAELLARCGRNDQAVTEYEKIASHYVDNGFYLKAMAVYKQIQKLANGNIEISLTLAALNEKQGLIGNALSEYKVVFDHYEKSGQHEEACKILEKMSGVDQENAEIALKLAETLHRNGRTDDAYQKFSRVALLLKNRGNDVLFQRVNDRIQTLFPDQRGFGIDLLEEQIKTGTISDAIPRLEQIIETEEVSPKVFTLLAEAYRAKGDLEGRIHTWSRKLHHFPAEVDAREGLLECILEQGDFEESLQALQLYSPELMMAGHYQSVENFYTILQGQSPYDTRILEGLKELYESTGEEVKLADIKLSLKLLSGSASAEPAPEPVTDVPESGKASGMDGLPGVNEIDFTLDFEMEPEKPETGIESDPLFTDDASVAEAGQRGIADVEIEFDDLNLEELELELELTGEGLAEETDYVESSSSQSPEEDSFELEILETAENETLEELPEQAVTELVLEEATGVEDSNWLEIDLSEEAGIELSSEEVYGTAELFSDDDAPVTVSEEQAPASFDRDETETRFSLGIAYKEMGLFDEAMKEFSAASVDPERTVDCIILKGMCLREKGEPEKAEEVLAKGINLCTNDPEKLLNLKFELALLHEACGRNVEALRLFREIFTANPGFRDTLSKIAMLQQQKDTGVFDLSDVEDMDIDLCVTK